MSYTVTGVLGNHLQVRTADGCLDDLTIALNGPFDVARITLRPLTPHGCGLLLQLKPLLRGTVLVLQHPTDQTNRLLSSLGYQPLFPLPGTPHRTTWAADPEMIFLDRPRCKTYSWKRLLADSLTARCLDVLPADTKLIDAAMKATTHVTVLTDDYRFQRYAMRLLQERT